MTTLNRRELLGAITGAGVIATSGCLGRGQPTFGGTPEDDGGGGGDGSAIDGTSIRTDDTGCGSPDDDGVSATVTGDTITLDGVLPAPNPCHEAVLEEVTLDGDALSATVDVVDTTGTDEGCAMCQGRVAYLAEIDLADASTVESVAVDHATGDRHTTDPDEESTAADPDEDPTADPDENHTDDPDADSAVDDSSIETLDAACASGDGADVSVDFGDEEITVSGTLPAPNPCHEAVIEGTTIEDGRLSVAIDVRSTLEEGGVCVECVGAITYEATIELSDASAITAVTVEHASGAMSTVTR